MSKIPLEKQVVSLDLAKLCPKCKMIKPLASFYERKKFRWESERYQAYCKPCTSLRRKHWYENMGGRERTCERQKHHRLKFPAIYKEKHRKYNWNSKIAALSAYGSICSCCGENEPKFLAIDHVNGNGNNHRRSIGSQTIYLWLKKNNYPPGFQVLCHNCNMAKAFWKECPHETRATSNIA